MFEVAAFFGGLVMGYLMYRDAYEKGKEQSFKIMQESMIRFTNLIKKSKKK